MTRMEGIENKDEDEKEEEWVIFDAAPTGR